MRRRRARGYQGATCFIRTQALHWKTRRVSCADVRAAGRRVLHVRLAEQAKILVAEAPENNLDKMNERWLRWCV